MGLEPGPNVFLPMSAAIILGLCSEVAFLFGWKSLLAGVLFPPDGAKWMNVIVVWVVAIPFAAILLEHFSLERPTAVGTSGRGVHIEYRRSTVNLPWESIGPTPAKVSRGWGAISGRDDASGKRVSFWATHDQGVLVLGDPLCPIERFPDEYSEWIRKGSADVSDLGISP